MPMIATIILAVCLAAALIYIIKLKSDLARQEERSRQADRLLNEQRADFDRLNAEAEQRFARLAEHSLSVNSEQLRRQTGNALTEVLAPMKDDIERFRQTVTDAYSREARERFSLGEKVRELMDLNRAVGVETRRLSDAIKGNARMQGEWGEMILDNILERAGLRKGYEYQVQESMTDASGRRLRPDVLINYTEGRRIVIDSKVSIQDYFAMLDATDETMRDRYAKAHIASVKKHIAELRGKAYQDATGADATFDYVLMFIPHEGAFLAAMSLDNTLWETAYDSHVLIISPTHLMSIVKLIEQMWRQEKQNRNALAIAEEAGRMLDKFRGFVDDMDKIDKALQTSRTAWDDAFRKLATGAGNLVTRAEKLKALGAKSRKDMPERYISTSDEIEQ